MERLIESKIKSLKESMKSNLNFYFYNDVMKVFDELLEYRHLEEQGLLLKLPCKIGDTVWAITSPINLGFDEGESLCVYECVVESISFYKSGNHQIRLYSGEIFVVWHVRFSDFGRLIFLTKAEAEKALAEMEK